MKKIILLLVGLVAGCSTYIFHRPAISNLDEVSSCQYIGQFIGDSGGYVDRLWITDAVGSARKNASVAGATDVVIKNTKSTGFFITTSVDGYICK